MSAMVSDLEDDSTRERKDGADSERHPSAPPGSGRSCWVCGRFIRVGEVHECQGPRKPRPKYTYGRRNEKRQKAPDAAQKVPPRAGRAKQVSQALQNRTNALKTLERVREPP